MSQLFGKAVTPVAFVINTFIIALSIGIVETINNADEEIIRITNADEEIIRIGNPDSEVVKARNFLNIAFWLSGAILLMPLIFFGVILIAGTIQTPGKLLWEIVFELITSGISLILVIAVLILLVLVIRAVNRSRLLKQRIHLIKRNILFGIFLIFVVGGIILLDVIILIREMVRI